MVPNYIGRNLSKKGVKQIDLFVPEDLEAT